MNVESEGMLWIGVSASWRTLDPRRGIGVPPLSASIYLFRLLVSLALVSSTALHLRHRCIPALLLCLSPVAALRDTWIVGSHLPHYHTNRPLAHSDTAFILCPSHLRLAGDQPKSDLVHEQPFERAAGRSCELAREPLAWGTRRKSIILNHGVIGSNDQTTTRRTRFTPRRFARTCHVGDLSMSRRKDSAFPSARFLLPEANFQLIQTSYNKFTWRMIILEKS